jgi:hypothetical protein
MNVAALSGDILIGSSCANRWSMLVRHFVTRKGVAMPNTTALVPLMVGQCWDQMCWEILSHSFTPPNRTRPHTAAPGSYSVSLSLSLSVCLSVCLSICLSVCISL